MDSLSFKSGLKTNVYGADFTLYEEIDSTNKRMLRNLETEEIAEGAVYLALRQTDGVGSFGNSWESDKPLGLWLTIALYAPYKREPLSFVPAIALAMMLRNDYNILAHLKWPNDVLVANKKIAGILCQAKTLPNTKTACVIGVGLNVFHKELDFSNSVKENAISMTMINNVSYSLEDIFKNYMYYFEQIYNETTNLIASWNKYSNMTSKWITAKKDGEYIKAFVNGVTDEGYLSVEVNGVNEVWMSRGSLDIDTNY